MAAIGSSAAHARSLLHRAQFSVSVPDVRQLPRDEGLEIAFAGRSNTGKSSVLNALCNQRALARTSGTPGRTQHLVVFELDAARRLVDLPGFGYAKVSKAKRAHWEKMLPRYLETRQALMGMVLIMDVRHPLKPLEQQLACWCRDADLQLHVILNKCDKLSRNQSNAALHKVGAALARLDVACTQQLFSARNKEGLVDTYTVLAQWLAADVAGGELKKGPGSSG